LTALQIQLETYETRKSENRRELDEVYRSIDTKLEGNCTVSERNRHELSADETLWPYIEWLRRYLMKPVQAMDRLHFALRESQTNIFYEDISHAAKRLRRENWFLTDDSGKGMSLIRPDRILLN